MGMKRFFCMIVLNEVYGAFGLIAGHENKQRILGGNHGKRSGH